MESLNMSHHTESPILDLSSKSPSLSSTTEPHSPCNSSRLSTHDDVDVVSEEIDHSPSISAALLAQQSALLAAQSSHPQMSLMDTKQSSSAVNPFSLLHTTPSMFYGGLDSLTIANAFQSASGLSIYGNSTPVDGMLPPSSVNTAPWGMYLNHLTGRKKRKAPVSVKTEAASSPSSKSSKGDEDLESSKDSSYWDRRRKNNEAAKRSRDARRQKEEEIALRAAYLEQENLKLRAQVTILKNESAKLHFLLYQRTNSPKTNTMS